MRGVLKRSEMGFCAKCAGEAASEANWYDRGKGNGVKRSEQASGVSGNE
jgi:hypothetical protein